MYMRACACARACVCVCVCVCVCARVRVCYSNAKCAKPDLLSQKIEMSLGCYSCNGHTQIQTHTCTNTDTHTHTHTHKQQKAACYNVLIKTLEGC